MRLALTLLVFVMVGVTLTGALVIVLLSGPFPGAKVQQLFAWVALAGFVVALPVSYVIAGHILGKTRNRASKA